MSWFTIYDKLVQQLNFLLYLAQFKAEQDSQKSRKLCFNCLYFDQNFYAKPTPNGNQNKLLNCNNFVLSGIVYNWTGPNNDYLN